MRQAPLGTLFKLTSWTEFRAWVAALPFLVQLVAIMFLTDLVQYWVHRLFHRIPALWRFHAAHHSAQHMDWMAGARMHFLEILVLRGTTVFPMILLGFSQTAVNFAIHFPLFDKLFGTHHMPTDGRWPSGYGIGGHPVPKGYWQQFLYPFRRKK